MSTHLPLPQTLIALETSGACCGVALLYAQGDDVTVRVREHTGTASHAERLLPMLDELLVEADVAREGIQAVAFGQGPGGFTGLRVAAGVAQGLALALEVPVLPVVSHRAVASQVALREDEVVVVALDARMDEVYVAAYRQNGGQGDGYADDRCTDDLRALQAPVLLPVDALTAWSAAQLPRWSQDAGRALSVVAVGDGWALEGSRSGWRHIAADLRPDAESVARVAWRDWRAGRVVAASVAEQALPLYVRDKVAYTTAERARGAGGNPRAGFSAGFPDSLPSNIAAEIAAMTADDLPSVAALEASVQPHPWTLGNFADALAAGYGAWVLRESTHPRRLLGFAVLMAAPDVAHVLTIAVTRDAQRRGLGRRLLQQCEAHTREQNVPGRLLEVRVSNTTARAFYKSAGFTQIGVRREYYPMQNGQREDALMLQKMLPATQAQQALRS